SRGEYRLSSLIFLRFLSACGQKLRVYSPAGPIRQGSPALLGRRNCQRAGAHAISAAMNDVSSREEMPAVAAEATEPSRRLRVRPLIALLPYVMRYRGQVAAAMVALLIAAAATLVVPLAVRRMIDFGFSAERINLIDQY